MKRKSLLFLLLFALLAPWAAQAQTTVEIGDGTTTQYYVPIGTYYNYSITEQLYTAEEIGTAGTISSISFNYAGTAAKDFPITVYMANVDAADLSTGISLADADEVFDGTLSVTGAGWATIDLDTPFAYDGSSNLLIGINKGYVQWYSGGNWYGTAATNMARYTQNDSSPYTTSTIPGGTGSAYSTRPNIQMVITPSSGPVCEKPETLEVSNVTANSATLTWTGGSGTYNVEYKGGDAADWTAYLSNTTATTANLTNLAPGTSYSYRVQSVCSDGVSGWKSVTFTTMFGIPLVEEFGTAIPTGWAHYRGLLETVLEDPTALETYSYGWSFGSNNGVFDNHARVNIYGTSCNYWLVMPTVTMEDNVQLQFDLAYTAYSGTATNPQTTGTDDKFVVLANVGRGWTILRQWDNADSEYVLNDLGVTPTTVKINLSDYAGQPIAIAFYGESTVSNADNNLHIDNVSIDYKAACETPTSLAVNYEGGSTAIVTWADADLCDIDVNGTTYTNKTSPFEITGLELATVYQVAARANCGAAGVSDWVDPVSFHTDFCAAEDMCAITIEATDSYGDGWNGAAIAVLDYEMYVATEDYDAALIAEISNENLDGLSGSTQTEPETQTYTVNVCDGRTIIVAWISGDYDSEASYMITDPQGDEIVSGEGEGFDALAYDIVCNSTCRMPTDFVANDITGRTATLSWTENGEATAWTIVYMSENDEETTEIEVNTNPYTLTGLEPTTTYYAAVTPVCEVEKMSDVISWTTLEACPSPVVTVEPLPTSATVSWNGEAESYVLEYAEYVSTSGIDPVWLQYEDEDEMYTAIGNGSTAYMWTWGVMYPASMLGGNSYLSKLKIYQGEPDQYYPGYDITIDIYSDGDDAPGELIATETLTPDDEEGWKEITLADPVSIDPTKNLWIVLTTAGYYTMPAVQTTEANNQWVLDSDDDGNDLWANIGDLASSLAGYGWMIRAYVNSVEQGSLNWTTVDPATSPYTITPLEAEHDYVVRVRAICGGEDGESHWTMVDFTTPSLCDAAIDLTAEAEATSANLSWTGYQDSYNLRYWSPAHMLEFNAADFTQVGENYVADSVLTTYTINLNGFSGVGNVAIRHYGVTDMFRLNVDDIVVTNAQGQVVASEDFESGEINLNWVNYDNDGDGNVWDIWHITQQDANGEDVGNGEYCATSASYNSTGALTPDNWLIIPNVELGGTLTFVARGQDPSWSDEVFGVFVSTTELVVPGTDPVTVEGITNPYILPGLTPETPYVWQVQGVNCDGNGHNTEWSAVATFTTTELTTITQTVQLTAGTNWFSPYVDITLENLQTALAAATPNDDITIKSASANVMYTKRSHSWRPTPATFVWNVLSKYDIIVASDCEITLEGMPIDPSGDTITILGNGATTWLGFPFSESMTLDVAFADIAKNNDKLKSATANTTYSRGRWQNTSFTTLEPGQGYLYTTAVNSPDRALVYPTPSKAANNSVQPAVIGNNFNAVKVQKAQKFNKIDVEISGAPVKSAKDLINFKRIVNIKK